MKPGPPLSSETAPKTVRILQRGWFGFQRERAGCEAGVVWVSAGGVCETWASPVWVVVGVCETWASRACSMGPEMGSFGEAGVVWVSAGAWI